MDRDAYSGDILPPLVTVLIWVMFWKLLVHVSTVLAYFSYIIADNQLDYVAVIISAKKLI